VHIAYSVLKKKGKKEATCETTNQSGERARQSELPSNPC
jgi:hypothetical protein